MAPSPTTPERTPAPGADDGALDLDGGLSRALASLPPRQKQAVAYHYLADLPYADVAAIVGGSPDAARRAAADGIAALRTPRLRATADHEEETR